MMTPREIRNKVPKFQSRAWNKMVDARKEKVRKQKEHGKTKK